MIKNIRDNLLPGKLYKFTRFLNTGSEMPWEPSEMNMLNSSLINFMFAALNDICHIQAFFFHPLQQIPSAVLDHNASILKWDPKKDQ